MRRSLILSCAALALVGGAWGLPTADEICEANDVPLGEECDNFLKTQGSVDLHTIPTTKLPVVDVAGLRPGTETDITTSVTTIDAADLAVRDNPYIADQLRAVPGVGVSRSGAAGGLTQVRLRGAEANHTLVLIDGIEVSDPTTGETDFGLFSGLYPARIEVARGEQSALYGSDAIGGVINIVTSDAVGLRGQVEAGTDKTQRLNGRYGFDLGSGDLQIGGSRVSSDGVDTSGLGGETDGYENSSVFATGGGMLAEGWEVRALARYGEAEVQTDPDTDFDGRLDNADRVTESEQFTLGGAVSGGAFGVDHLFRASYNQVERENFADGVSQTVADSDRTKFAYSPSVDLVAGAADLTVSGLVDWEQENYTASDTAFGGFTNQDQTFETLGLAGEVQARFDALTLTASARHDDNDGLFDDASTWRVGGAYGFEFGGRLRASAGAGVKNPTFTELFGFFPGSFIGNPDLKPEQSVSWEIGWDQSYEDVTWSLTYFEAELEDEIFTDFIVLDTGDPSDPFDDVFGSTAENRTRRSERSGVEFAAQWEVSEAVALTGAVSNITSSNDSDTQEIRVPEWTGSLAVNWASQSKEGLRAGVALDYVGEQLDTDFGSFQAVTLDAYTLVSATAEYPVTDRLSVTLRGENLLDETVTDVFGYNGPGASVLFGVKVR